MFDLMENPKISVIVPVYNVGNYIGQCLRTLTHQTLCVPYEVIVINDGSQDNSLSVLRSTYAAADSRVRVIDQPNAGVSAARTAGMAAARGEYLCFVDGDDYIADNYLEQLYRACTLNHADISCCYYYWHIITNDILFEYPFRCRGVYDNEQAFSLLLRDALIQSFLWGKMYRRELFERAHIVFPKMCFEDLAVLHRIFALANRVAIIDEPLYYYNIHADSTLGAVSPAKVTDYVRAIAMIRESLDNRGMFAEYRDSYRSLARWTRVNCFVMIVKMHLQRHDLRGCLTDLLGVRHAIKDCCQDDFRGSSVCSRLGKLLHRKQRRLAR